MKNALLLLLTTSVVLLIISCGQDDTKKKELELRERELVLKEKELAIKQNDSLNNNTKTGTTSAITNTKTDLIENNGSDISLIATSIKVPITVTKLNALVGQYNIFEPYDQNEDPNNGAIYKWKLKTGLLIKGQGGFIEKPDLSDKISFIVFSAKDKNTIVNCAFGLTLNKSTLNECKQNISNLKRTSMGQEYYKFLKDNVYHYLHFGANNTLIEIIINSEDWENSGG